MSTLKGLLIRLILTVAHMEALYVGCIGVIEALYRDIIPRMESQTENEMGTTARDNTAVMNLGSQGAS